MKKDYELTQEQLDKLRDDFAMAALPGLLTRNWDAANTSDEEIIRQWGISAYAVADSMLKAREGRHD